MRRTDRLVDILRILRDGQTCRADEIAERLGVSVRTIYRDMDTLAASGLPVRGTRGAGYVLIEATTLPPLTLTGPELDALNLALAIVGEAADPDLKAAAQSLADKIDAGLPAETVAPAEAWKFAVHPFADAARGFAHLAPLRAAIKSRQKLRLEYRSPDGIGTRRVVRPLRVASLGRVWTLTAWCELRNDFREFRVDLVESVTPLPELFTDEPGKTLAEYTP
ncbi:HTH domain-containing protein [Cribrihabitans marinus]|uniref:HTH domain-containing protein n=1 Tax=Cribrihabitans marinus TaxID=1227549 RepID=A0A1H6R9E5_9RHOB|nr:YafY family protein [Cribrihabitans marinus]GGH20520.1 transcriptional regulator [Cribrihabitans marinus]SEI51096.1 HTH domain-containing protein [Cribrihabitans marinus]